MTTQNVINDLGTVTKVPNKILDDLVSKLNLCIGSAIHDALTAKEQTVVLNIGIGSLSVDLVDMQCKFVPGKELKSVIKRSLSDKVDPLECALEETLIQKLLSIYNEAI